MSSSDPTYDKLSSIQDEDDSSLEYDTYSDDSKNDEQLVFQDEIPEKNENRRMIKFDHFKRGKKRTK